MEGSKVGVLVGEREGILEEGSCVGILVGERDGIVEGDVDGAVVEAFEKTKQTNRTIKRII